MKTLDLKLTRIGNSRGIRLPVALIKRYGFSDPLAAEVRVEGLLLKPKRRTKLSWEETAQAMAASEEDWSDWDTSKQPSGAFAESAASFDACHPKRPVGWRMPKGFC